MFALHHYLIILYYSDQYATATVTAPARALDDFLIHNPLTELLNVEVTFPGQNGQLPGMFINSQPIRLRPVPILRK